ncbi:hypothetical protein LCGC14_1821510, partial [marine sediment metagenome]
MSGHVSIESRAFPVLETLEPRLLLSGEVTSGPGVGIPEPIVLSGAQQGYEHQTVTVGEDTEHQLLLDGFHFATFVEDGAGRLVFRSHPDQNDVNGWGTSYFLNVFLAGADAGGGAVDNVQIAAGGVEVWASGLVVQSSGGDYGTWEWSGLVGYAPAEQRVTGQGTLDVTLIGPLDQAGADLNLDRISSNFLYDVPLQTGGTGNTGDMSEVRVRYAQAGDPRDFTWAPSPAQPAHFPSDLSMYLGIQAVGEVNVVDTLALGEQFQIDIAGKPTFSLAFSSQSASGEMIAGLSWDQSEGKNFAADNVGLNHLVLQGTSSTDFSFNFLFESVPPPNQPPTIASLAPTPDPVGQGDGLTLLANTVADIDGTVAKVAFYRDGDTDGVGQPGELLGEDTNGADGWTWTGPAGWAVAGHTYLAQATDDDGAVSSWATVSGSVRDPGIVVVGAGGAKSLIYTEADMTTATLTFKGGTANVRLTGDGLAQVAGKKGVTVTG